MATGVVPLKALEAAGLRLALDYYGRRGKRQAAEELGISLKTLYKKLHQHDLTQYLQPSTRRRRV